MCELYLKSIELVLCWSCFGRSKNDTSLRNCAFNSWKSLSCPSVYCV